jgi:hypothetical protein
MQRPAVRELISLGAFPDSSEVNLDVIRKQEKLLSEIEPPITKEEAYGLVQLFGTDDYFGAAWTLLHLIETAPGWPIASCLTNVQNEWIALLKRSAENAGAKFS